MTMAKLKQHTTTAQPVPQQEDLSAVIAQKAYELYEQGGRIEGRDLENWLEAERLIRTTRSTQG
jgi:hypothetical protein